MFFELSFNLFLRIDFMGENIIFDALVRISPKIKINIIIILILFLKIMFVDSEFWGLIIFIGIINIIRKGKEFHMTFAFEGLEGIEWVVIVIKINNPPTYIKNNIIPTQGEFKIYDSNSERNRQDTTSRDATISWLLSQIIMYIEANIKVKIKIIFSIVNLKSLIYKISIIKLY